MNKLNKPGNNRNNTLNESLKSKPAQSKASKMYEYPKESSFHNEMDLGPDLNNPVSMPISIHSAAEDVSAKHEESNMEQLSMPSVSAPSVPGSGAKLVRST